MRRRCSSAVSLMDTGRFRVQPDSRVKCVAVRWNYIALLFRSADHQGSVMCGLLVMLRWPFSVVRLFVLYCIALYCIALYCSA